MPRRPREPLPDPLGSGPFEFGEAREADIGRGRLRRDDISHPHRGLYVPAGTVPEGIEGRCEALLPLLGPGQWFSHATAARLWGMPLPKPYRDDETLHVISLADGEANGRSLRMRRPGVSGWEGRSARGEVRGILPVISPADVWGQLATRGATAMGVTLTREWLVAVGDHLLTGPRVNGRRHPLCTRAQLEDAAARRRGARGARALEWALERVREPVDSPKETQLRMGLVALGLPEPEVQVAVDTAEGVQHADLGYRHARLLLEYQGEEHRVSRRRWLRDLRRVQLMQDAGFHVMLVGADDVDDADAGRADAGDALGPGATSGSGSGSGSGSSGDSAAGFGPLPGPGLVALAARVRRALAGESFGR